MHRTVLGLRRSIGAAASAVVLAVVASVTVLPGVGVAAPDPRSTTIDTTTGGPETWPDGAGEPREPGPHFDIRDNDVRSLAVASTTRDEIMARAHTWVAAAVPYSISHWRDGYRADCSGFVSLAWNTGASYTTRTLDQVSHEITRDELLPGDALLWRRWDGDQVGHVRVFGGWLDTARDRYWVYEQTPPRATYNEYSWSQTQAVYHPIRYDFVAQGAAPAQSFWEFATTGSSVAAPTWRDDRMEAFTSAAIGVRNHG